MYKISCKDPNITEIYIGSTGNLKKRGRDHKSGCNNKNAHNHNLKVYKYIRANGGWTNFNMTKISDFECDNTIEKLKEERRLIEELGATLNVIKPSRTVKEYRQDNKEKVKKTNKEWYERNKERVKKRDKVYREKNKEKIKKRKKEYYIKKKALKLNL
tara:strand:- start:14 stop:487 length:474 start_codon:yes stop_codon:yes gene_type:complete